MITRVCVCCVALLLVTAVSQTSAEMVIATEDFESGTGPTVWTNNISDFFFNDPNVPEQGLFLRPFDLANYADFPDSLGFNPNFAGHTLFGLDLGAEAGDSNGSASPFNFVFDAVDVSNFENVTFSFDYSVLFANNDAGSYEIFVDGQSQGAVEFYNDPDTIITGTVSEFIGTANTVSLVLSGTLNGQSDGFELDNFALTGNLINAVPEPMTAATFVIGMSLISRRRRS